MEYFDMSNSNEGLKAGFEGKGSAKAFKNNGSRDVPAANMPVFNRIAEDWFSIDMKYVEYDSRIASGNLLGDELDKAKAVMSNLEKQQAETRKKIEQLNKKGNSSAEQRDEPNKKPGTNEQVAEKTASKVPSMVEYAKHRLAEQRRNS